MLPLPPVIAWTLAAIGAVAIAKVLARQWLRVNAELDAHKQAIGPGASEKLRTLRLDPNTGEYRPE
jgi:hypothetical protein